MPGEYAGPRRSLSSVSPRPSSNSLTSEPFSSSRISRISFRFIGIPSHALDVGSGTRVHLDHVPLVQEEGDRHEGAGLQPRRLGRSAHRVPAGSGFSTWSPLRKVCSMTAPVFRFLIFVRTKAPPLPGLTCWK